MTPELARLESTLRCQRKVFADRYEAGAVKATCQLSDAERYAVEQGPVPDDEAPQSYEHIRGQ